MPFSTFLGQLCRRTQVINVETWCEYSKDVGLIKKKDSRCRFNEEGRIRDVGLVKKVGFEM
jgi:hypothetical protein